MKEKNKHNLNNGIHKELILIVSPSFIFSIIIDKTSKKVLSYSISESKQNLEELEIVFETVSVFVLNIKFTLVPSALFNESNSRNYLQFTTDVKEVDEVVYEKIELQKSVLIWSLESAMKNRITNIYSGALFKNVLSPFIANSLSVKNKISSLFFEDYIVISVIKNNKLSLVNTFEIKSLEDALYYHLLLFQSMELKESEISVQVGGIYKSMQLFLEKMETYFSNVTKSMPFDLSNVADNSFQEIINSIKA